MKQKKKLENSRPMRKTGTCDHLQRTFYCCMESSKTSHEAAVNTISTASYLCLYLTLPLGHRGEWLQSQPWQHGREKDKTVHNKTTQQLHLLRARERKTRGEDLRKYPQQDDFALESLVSSTSLVKSTFSHFAMSTPSKPLISPPTANMSTLHIQ